MYQITGLNPEQEEACSYTEGPLLILAGAGSGKTRVITHRIAYLIEGKGVNPRNILAITFTNKAAEEMRERVDRMLTDGAKEIWVKTFHSMCVRILRRFYEKLGGKNNFNIYDTDDQKAIIKETLKHLGLDEKQYPIRGMISSISKAKEEFLSPEEYARNEAGSYRGRNVADIYAEYEKRLQKNNALDFDDLINKTIRLFMEHPDVLSIYQERFRYIMVDEYQDTNHAQFVLVKLLAAKYRNLCVVGDDDQSIYKFRGANIYNILNFEDEYPDAKVTRLEQNYRSTANILNAANAVIANNTGRKEKTLWTENEEGEKLSYTLYPNDREEARGIVTNLRMLRRKGLSNSDLAVLYRTNAQSRVIEEQLVREGVPYQMVGGTNFYARKEIRDMVGYLKCISNPADDQSLARIINVPRRGIGDSTVVKMREYADAHDMSLYDVVVEAKNLPDIGRSAGKVSAFAEMMQGFRRKAEENDLHGLYQEILQKTGYRSGLLAENTEEAKGRVENLDELGKKIADFELNHEDATLLTLLEEISLVADTDNEDETGDRLTLMTLHSAKGLEFPVVFMVGMEERLFPSGMAIDSDDPDAVEEERRLCYVGITRAQKKLFLSAARQRMLNGNYIYPGESRFIKEIPKYLLEKKGAGHRDEYEEEIFDVFRRKPASENRWREKKNPGDQRNPSYQRNLSNPVSFADEGSGSTIRREPVEDEWRGTTFRPKKAEPEKKGIEDLFRNGSIGKVLSMSRGFQPDYQVGDQVRHIKFGKGVVTELIKGGNDYEVAVNFESCGEKRMFASLAKLRKV